MLLAQPVTNPTAASPVVTSSPVLPSVAAAMDHKADESQVFVLVTAVALFLMSLLEAILEQPPLVRFSYVEIAPVLVCGKGQRKML